ncbi:hypothetical protein D3C72_1870510 [compost metagenome]
MRVTLRHGLLRGFNHVGGRVKVGLAQAQHDDGLALALELVGGLGDAHDVGHTDGADAVGRAEGRGRNGGVHCW